MKFEAVKPTITSRNRPYYSDVTGPDMGLILVINNTSDDYFYNILNTKGFTVRFKSSPTQISQQNFNFQIQVHNSYEFPDPSSGSAIERLVGPGEEIFVRVDATSMTSERDIANYRAERRQCLFPDENPSYNKKYTRSECILNCRIRSVKALCDCVPFQLPPPNVKSDPPKICTLQHVPCLNKYRSKDFFGFVRK